MGISLCKQKIRDGFSLFCLQSYHSWAKVFWNKQLNHADRWTTVLSKPYQHWWFQLYLSFFKDCRSVLQIQHIGMSFVTWGSTDDLKDFFLKLLDPYDTWFTFVKCSNRILITLYWGYLFTHLSPSLDPCTVEFLVWYLTHDGE